MFTTEIESYRLQPSRLSQRRSARRGIDCGFAPAPPTRQQPVEPPPAYSSRLLFDYATMYAPVSDEGFELPAIPIEKIDPQFLRQIVPDPTGERPGTVVVDTTSTTSISCAPAGRPSAMASGSAAPASNGPGDAVIQWKQKWPKWTPPDEMVARQPELATIQRRQWRHARRSQEPARRAGALLFQGGQDTLYRLHGSPEWNSIGKSVSSGCVRLINQDMIDLYNRVPNQTPVIVTAGIGGQMVATANRRAIPIDAGVPEGSILLDGGDRRPALLIGVR